MAAKTQSFQQQKRISSLLVNRTLIMICLIWLIPTIGLLITSFRSSQDIFSTGWWTVFPHREMSTPARSSLTRAVNLDGTFPSRGHYH